MSMFLCGVHVTDDQPAAFALFEALGGASPRYALRALREIDSAAALSDALASERQYAGAVTVVTTGGKAAVKALHTAASATPYTVTDRLGAKGETVSGQQLADTFERLFRDGAVATPSSDALATAAFEALHRASDLDAVATDSDRNPEGDLEDGAPGSIQPTLDGASYAGEGAAAARVVAGGSRAVPRTGRHVEVSHPAAAAVAIALWHAERARVADAAG